MIVEQARYLRDSFLVDRPPLVPRDEHVATYQARIAQWFSANPNAEPRDEYNIFFHELMAQWRACIKVFDITFHDDDPTPLHYVDSKGNMSSRVMTARVDATKALHVYRSDGSHTFLDRRGVYFKGRWETANSVFRAVHDLLGHCATGASFSWEGETKAYYSHASTFSMEAVGALFSETVAQQSYYAYYGDYSPQRGVWYPSEEFNPPLR